MPLVIADRVKDATTTAGAGDLTLAGAVIAGYRPFNAVLAVGDTCYYTIENGAEWEVGLGTYTAANTLARTSQIASSNGGATVVLSAGTKHVFITAAARQISPEITKVLANATTTAETIIARFQLPANFFAKANDAAVLRAIYNSGGTAGTHTIRVRLGTAGTTADTQILIIGPTASIVANSYCEAQYLIVTPTVGSAGTVRASGFSRFSSTINGLGALALPAAPAVNTTGQLFLSYSIQASAASATASTQGAWLQKGL